jgi:hypothetical protein
MAMSSLEVLGTIRADGSLELDEKLSLPPGRVKVRVEPTPATEAKPAEGLVEFVDWKIWIGRGANPAAGSFLHRRAG